MTVKNNRIISATRAELFKRYLDLGYDDIYSFDEYMDRLCGSVEIVEDNNEM